MGVDTKGYIKNTVKAIDVLAVVKNNYDENAIFDAARFTSNTGSIIFKDGEDNRSLFYCITHDDIENTEFEGHESSQVCLSLGFWGNSVDIMQNVVKNFGGYVDDNDCDSLPAYYVPKLEDNSINEYIETRKSIEKILDSRLDNDTKSLLADQILKHLDEIKQIKMNINLSTLANKYIKHGHDFLTQEYGEYEGKTTGMDVEEDTNDTNYRDYLKNEILKDESVKNCWWETESYGHTLWIEF